VGRYILALLEAFRRMPELEVRPYARRPPAILGSQLLTPLAARHDRASLFHGPANALPLIRPGLPGVVTVHDLAIYEHPEWFPRGQWFATRVVVPHSIRHAQALICPSAATRAAIGRLFGVPAGRCHVIPHGVERAFGEPIEARTREQIRTKYQLPARYLLQVGTVQPRKNYETSLRALTKMPPASRLPLVAVGNFGWGYEPVTRLIADLQLKDWVRFVGYVGLEDLPALYQLAEVAIFPSLDEGFGIPVLEAFAAGTPLVASNAGAIPEVAGDAALLCDPLDAQALADNIQRLRDDPDLRGRLVAAGRSRAAMATWDASARAHGAVYESVARR